MILNLLHLPWQTEVERPLYALEKIYFLTPSPIVSFLTWKYFRPSHNFLSREKSENCSVQLHIHYKNNSNDFETSSIFQKTTKIMILSKHPLVLPLFLITASSNFFNPVASAETAFETKSDLFDQVDAYCEGIFDENTSPYGWVVVVLAVRIVMKQRHFLGTVTRQTESWIFFDHPSRLRS